MSVAPTRQQPPTYLAPAATQRAAAAGPRRPRPRPRCGSPRPSSRRCWGRRPPACRSPRRRAAPAPSTCSGAVQLTPDGDDPGRSTGPARRRRSTSSPRRVVAASAQVTDSHAARRRASRRARWSSTDASCSEGIVSIGEQVSAGGRQHLDPRPVEVPQGRVGEAVGAGVLRPVGQHRAVRPDRGGHPAAYAVVGLRGVRRLSGPARRCGASGPLPRRGCSPRRAKPSSSPGSSRSWRPGRRPRSRTCGWPRSRPGRRAAAGPTRGRRTGRDRAAPARWRTRRRAARRPSPAVSRSCMRVRLRSMTTATQSHPPRDPAARAHRDPGAQLLVGLPREPQGVRRRGRPRRASRRRRQGRLRRLPRQAVPARPARHRRRGRPASARRTASTSA